MRKKIRKFEVMLEEGRIDLKRVAKHGDCYYLIEKMDKYFNEHIKESKKWQRK